MLAYLWLIPTIPLLSSLVLAIFGGKFNKTLVTTFGVGSVATAAIFTLLIYLEFDPNQPVSQVLWNWIPLSGGNSLGFSLYLDGLSMLMLCVVTGVGSLIHWYAAAYMREDTDLRRFFVYMNLFVAAMLILVLADNLVLLYLGWEGVGLCSFLLVGFWYGKPANAMAAKKAFIVTRIGDTAMLIGLLILYQQYQELTVQPLLQNAATDHDPQMMYWACVLLLLGAAGKSAQFPLHTWLPDAMAGPTPVSALIHAATMVTAGVYLIARMHPLYIMTPDAMYLVALTGAVTLLISGLAALGQTDLKRVLAYSTISQIGYMFLSLGAGGWGPAVFHLMTHAFFKALLFLTAGTIILKCHHNQDLAHLAGSLRKLPIAAAFLIIGLIALAALPGTSGFFSKEAILEEVYTASTAGPALWWMGVAGALVTAMYSARLVFILWFTPNDKHESLNDFGVTSHFVVPLLPLAVLAVIGGWWAVELSSVFTYVTHSEYPAWAHYVAIATPWLGIGLAYVFFKPGSNIHSNSWLSLWFHGGLGFDALYERILVKPFQFVAKINKSDVVDLPVKFAIWYSSLLHEMGALSQTGKIRWYAMGIIAGTIFLIGVPIWLL